jgi:hypothetical protein
MVSIGILGLMYFRIHQVYFCKVYMLEDMIFIFKEMYNIHIIVSS